MIEIGLFDGVSVVCENGYLADLSATRSIGQHRLKRIDLNIVIGSATTARWIGIVDDPTTGEWSLARVEIKIIVVVC
jgi:hypothetical protein